LWDSNRSNSGSRRVGSSKGVAIVLLSVVAPVFPEIARSSSSLLFPGPEFLEPGPELLESEPEFSDVASATISKVFGTQDNERIISAVDGSHNSSSSIILSFWSIDPSSDSSSTAISITDITWNIMLI
jgi:hypothetical protein